VVSSSQHMRSVFEPAPNADFPESLFPPSPDRRADYLAACRRGSAAMAESSVVIAGLARNIGRILPAAIERTRRLCSLFADARVIVFENDSHDDTKRQLGRWATSDERVVAVSEDTSDPPSQGIRCLERARRMARYRTRCQQLVLEHHPGFGFVIVVDFDAEGGWSTDGIANTFGHAAWDFVGANGLIYRRSGLDVNALRHYDSWALRFDSRRSPLRTVEAARLDYRRGDPLVPVTSCFGGLGIYTTQAFAAGRYDSCDMEHVGFHASMAAAGFSRMFLNPSQIVVHGRRHRTLDRCVRMLLRVARAGGGVPWMHPADASPPSGGFAPPVGRTA
jgi:hypothetical protein